MKYNLDDEFKRIMGDYKPSFMRRIILPFIRTKNKVFGIPWKIFGIQFRYKYIKQRMTRGISDCDIWNLDWFIAKSIITGIKYLKENGYGYNPEILDENGDRINPISFPKDGSSSKEYYDKGREAWDYALDSIIEGFEAWFKLVDGYPIDENTYIWPVPGEDEFKELDKKYEKGKMIYLNNFGSFWD